MAAVNLTQRVGLDQAPNGPRDTWVQLAWQGGADPPFQLVHPGPTVADLCQTFRVLFPPVKEESCLLRVWRGVLQPGGTVVYQALAPSALLPPSSRTTPLVVWASGELTVQLLLSRSGIADVAPPPIGAEAGTETSLSSPSVAAVASSTGPSPKEPHWYKLRTETDATLQEQKRSLEDPLEELVLQHLPGHPSAQKADMADLATAAAEDLLFLSRFCSCLNGCRQMCPCVAEGEGCRLDCRCEACGNVVVVETRKRKHRIKEKSPRQQRTQRTPSSPKTTTLPVDVQSRLRGKRGGVTMRATNKNLQRVVSQDPLNELFAGVPRDTMTFPTYPIVPPPPQVPSAQEVTPFMALVPSGAPVKGGNGMVKWFWRESGSVLPDNSFCLPVRSIKYELSSTVFRKLGIPIEVDMSEESLMHLDRTCFEGVVLWACPSVRIVKTLPVEAKTLVPPHAEMENVFEWTKEEMKLCRLVPKKPPGDTTQRIRLVVWTPDAFQGIISAHRRAEKAPHMHSRLLPLVLEFRMVVQGSLTSRYIPFLRSAESYAMYSRPKSVKRDRGKKRRKQRAEQVAARTASQMQGDAVMAQARAYTFARAPIGLPHAGGPSPTSFPTGAAAPRDAVASAATNVATTDSAGTNIAPVDDAGHSATAAAAAAAARPMSPMAPANS